MYGLVNNAFVDYAKSQIGESQWLELCSEKNMQQIPYQNLESYSDESTVGIVVAIAEAQNISVEDCLKKLGIYWIQFALNSPYSDMLTKSGRTMKELIQNLDSLHTRLSLSFNALKAPSFWVSEVSSSEYQLHYSSDRDGLTAFVEGLLVGLSNHFQVDIDISEPTLGESGETIWKIKT